MADSFGRSLRLLIAPALVILLIAVAVWQVGSDRLLRAVRAGLAAARSTDPASDTEPTGAAEHAEDPIVPVTIWGNDAEIFFECPCCVAGTPVRMVTHVTVRDTGKPLETGTIVLEDAAAAGTVIGRATAPERPGIFVVPVTFPNAAEHRTRFRVTSPQLGERPVVIDVPPIKVFGSSAEARAAAPQTGEDDGSAITLLKEQQWPIGLRTAPVARATLSARLAVPGQVVAPPTSQAIVAPPISGKVLPLHKKLPAVGDTVAAGQVLALIEPPLAGAEGVQLLASLVQLHSIEADLAARQLEVENRIKTAQIELGNAERNHERLLKLSDPGVVARKELLEAQFAVELARSRLGGAREQLQPYQLARERLAGVLRRFDSSATSGSLQAQLQIPISSPIAGTVVETHGVAGQLVEAQEPLFKVIDLGTLWIEAKVSEYDVGQVEMSKSACCRLSAYPNETLPILGDGHGKRVSIGTVVDRESRTVPIRFEASNPDGRLRVGMFTEVLFETRRASGVLAVPKSALVEEAGQWVVFVQKGGESFEKRPVTIGVRDTDRVEILSGLAEAEQVVIHGAYAVRLASLGPAIPEHHHH